MVRVIETYACELCGFVHKTVEAAHKCEAQGWPEALCEIGDFVGFGAHGWWNEGRDWVLAQNARFDGGVLMSGPWLSADQAPAGNLRVDSGWSFLPVWRILPAGREKLVNYPGSGLTRKVDNGSA